MSDNTKNTSYDLLVTHEDGSGPFRHTFTTPEARDAWAEENRVEGTVQNVNKLTGEIIEETVSEYVEAEKEGSAPITYEPDNNRNRVALTNETPLFDETRAENPSTGD